MRALETRLAGAVLIEAVVRGDARGCFQETYRSDAFGDLGIDLSLH